MKILQEGKNEKILGNTIIIAKVHELRNTTVRKNDTYSAIFQIRDFFDSTGQIVKRKKKKKEKKAYSEDMGTWTVVFFFLTAVQSVNSLK